MLPRELVRARVVDGQVRPVYVDPDSRALLQHASDLIALFDSLRGRTQGELEESLTDLLIEGQKLVVRRGLAKLLRDRATFEPDGDLDPVALRQEVFEAAAEQKRRPAGEGAPRLQPPFDRGRVLAEVAQRWGVTTGQLETALFADLKAAHRLTAFESLAPRDLLLRYNLAQAEGVLLSATRVDIDIEGNSPARYRQLFRFVKFFKLSFRAEEQPAGYRIVLDGPLSLFHQPQRYGLRMAQFLPALLLCDGWRLTATLSWSRAKRPGVFVLTPEDGLVTHYRDTGTWVPEEQRWFEDRFPAVAGSWTLRPAERIVSLGGRGVLIPDYVLRHEDGREALLEIVWFWRSGGLQRHLELLADYGPSNLVLAVSERLKEGEDTLPPLPPHAIRFKKALRPASVRKAAEAVPAVHEIPPA